MPALDSKIPPPAVVLVMAVFMWLLSRAVTITSLRPAREHLARRRCYPRGIRNRHIGCPDLPESQHDDKPVKPHASTLVTRGVYAMSRNPMYLGGLIMLLGWAVFLQSGLAFLFLPVYVLYINRFQIGPEERVLASLFGETYVAYQARARRWL